jgi:hypothetical protein
MENKWCKPCQINSLKQNFANWTSGNKKIDDFIQEMQLKIENYYNTMIEWIPYDQLSNIKNIYKDNFITINSAIWKDGLLEYNYKERKHIKKPNKEVTLKCSNNLQNDISEFLNEVCNLIFLILKMVFIINL